MSSDFCKQVLKVIVAQTCQNMGWNAIHSTPLDILIDILHRYLQELSRTTHRYCEQFGRTEPNLDDLGLSFQDLGISLIELEEYMNSVDPIKLPFDVPKFPLPRKNQILHQQPDSDEKSVTADADISDEAVENVTDDDFTEKGPSLLHQVVSGDEVETQNDEENLTLKRCLPDTTSTPPPASKRLRAMTEEELSNSARDLTSVFMTSGGVISPAREGKLPDAKTPHYTVPVARPDTPDGAKLTPENSENTKEPPKEVKEPAKTEIGEDSVEKVEIPPKKNGRKNKPPCKPKKLTFVKQNSSSDKINLKISSGDAVKNNIDDSEKVSDDKPKKKTPSKNSKSSKKSASKSDKTQLAGIVPLRAEESKVGKVSGTDDQVTKFDDMDDSSKALKHHASDKKKSAEEKTSYENSLDDTIENVIQKAMQSESNMSDDEMIVKYRGRKLKTKDVYDFTDSGGEGSEPRTPKTPDVVASKAMKEKLEDISPSLTSKLEGSPKTSKKKSKEKSTKSSSKKDSNVESKSESAIDSSFLFAEEPVMTSPFHNPPGFPSRPPLPLLPGFHAGLHPSFTTNLGPPPPAHQGVTASNHPSMLPSSPFYPSFPPMMQNLSQFAEMPFSGMGMIPPFASSHFPGMLPTFAHNPRDFYASGNDIQANSISAGVADKNPLTFDKKVSQNTQGPTSSSPQKLSTSPVQVLSIKSEPNCAIQTSKIEIKSSLLGSVVGESSSFGSSKVKAEKSEKTKNKEHKKDKKDKTEKKEKVKKKEKKEKIKEDLLEIPEMKPEKKDKSKSKDKKKSKHKDEEVKEEPLQKITLKLASSKIIIKSVSSPSTPAVEEKKMPSPRPEPVPPSPPPPLDLNIKPDLPPIVTKAAVKLSPPIKSPSARGRKKGRPCKNPTPKKKAVEPVTMLEPEPEELPSMSLITETVGTTLDEDGNKIWICPKCGRPDDGSAMIGCDSCDDWYHWVCVKIVVPPKEEDSWFCTRCISKQHQQLSSRKKKKKHRKEK